MRVGNLIAEHLPAPPTQDGYTFIGWAYDDAGSEPVGEDDVIEEEDVVDGNLTLYAVWATNYTLTINLNGGSYEESTDPFDITAYDGQNILEALDGIVPTRAGHTFEGWAYDNAGTQPVGSEDTVSSNDTIYAHWEEIVE